MCKTKEQASQQGGFRYGYGPIRKFFGGYLTMDCYLRQNLRLPKKSCLPLKKRGLGELLSLNYFSFPFREGRNRVRKTLFRHSHFGTHEELKIYAGH